MLQNLSKKQVIILLITIGVASLVGLLGLSQTSEDYYATAAVWRAIFTGVLTFVVLSPIYFHKPKLNNLTEPPNKLVDRVKLVLTALICVFFIFVLLNFALLVLFASAQ